MAYADRGLSALAFAVHGWQQMHLLECNRNGVRTVQYFNQEMQPHMVISVMEIGCYDL